MFFWITWISLFSLFFSNPCNIDRNSHPEIEQIIQGLKAKFNVHSIACSFTAIRESLTIEELNGIQNFDFAFENDNFYLGAYFDKNRKLQNDKMPTLYKLIKQTLERKSERYEEDRIYRFMMGHYIYQNIPQVRAFYKEKENIFIAIPVDRTQSVNYSSTNGNPLLLIGYIGGYIFSNDLIESVKYKRYIPEFLEKDGKYYLKKEDEYTIIWHEVIYPEEEGREEISAEFWIDKEGNIKKIVEGKWLARSYDWERIRSIIGPERELNCDSFHFVKIITEFYDFKTFENNICIPLTAVISFYRPDEEDERIYRDLTEQFTNGKIDDLEYGIKIENWRMKYVGSLTLNIDPNTLVINQDIDDSIFIAPPPNFSLEDYFNKNKKEKNEELSKLKMGNILFIFLIIVVCITCLIIILLSLRRVFS